jgi:hypothetical protein
MLVEAIKGGVSLPERRITQAESIPSLQDLAALGNKTIASGTARRSASV